MRYAVAVAGIVWVIPAARFLRWIAEAFEQPFLLSVQG